MWFRLLAEHLSLHLILCLDVRRMGEMQDANNPAKFLTVVNKVLHQVNSSSPIIVKEWAKRGKSWLKDCHEASTWERVAELTDKIAQEDSIFFDWDKVFLNCPPN
jgi:hypothetical protein